MWVLPCGIHPKLTTFVKTFSCLTDEKRLKSKAGQESARKDVRRAFEVLKRR